MAWSGYKEFINDQYGKLKVVDTINMKGVWEEKNQPDKRKVEIRCPNCDHPEHPLMRPHTVELSHKRTKYKSHYHNRIDTIIYGAECKECKFRYKFGLICDAFHYPKLGIY